MSDTTITPNNSRQEPDRFTILDRPQRLPFLRDLKTIHESATELARSLAPGAGGDGAPLVLPFAGQEENSAELLVSLTMGSLWRQGRRPRLVRPGQPVHLEAMPVYDCVIVHHAPQVAIIAELLQVLQEQSRPFLLTGDPLELERLGIEAGTRWLEPLALEGGADRLNRELERILADLGQETSLGLYRLVRGFMAANISVQPEEVLARILAKSPGEVRRMVATLEEVATRDLETRLFRTVCAADCLGVCLPFSLLAEATETDPETAGTMIEAMQQRSLLFWNDRSTPPALTVSTGGVRLARHLLAPLGLTPDTAYKEYRNILAAVDWDEAADRHAAMQLIRNLGVNPARRRRLLGEHGTLPGLRELVGEICSRLWEQAQVPCQDPAETLGWAALFRDLALFEPGLKLLEAGAQSWPDDIRLPHARAHLLAAWSNIDPEKPALADQAFEKAYLANPANPYIPADWAMFEMTMGRTGHATNLLDDALRIHPGNPVLLAARIDLALDEGDWQTAEDLLTPALASRPWDIRLLHMRARLAFALGKTGEAGQDLDEIARLDPYNTHVHSTRAEMARVEGRWEEAERELGQGLALDPENRVLLNGRANLLVRRGNGFLRQGDRAACIRLLEEADRLFGDITAIEGGESSHTLVGRVNLRLLLADARQDEQRARELATAEELLRRLHQVAGKNDRVLHLLGRLEQARGNLDRAAQLYDQILDQNPRNRYALLSAALLAQARGDQAGLDRYGRRLRDLVTGPAARKMSVWERRELEERVQELGYHLPT